MNRKTDAKKARMTVEKMRKMYEEMIHTDLVDKEKRSELEKDILTCQQPDGSFGAWDCMRGESDCVVHYAFYPTYYATAALLYKSNIDGLSEEAEEVFVKGLTFAVRRRLLGHGFDATAQLMETLNIYMQAGLFIWMCEEKTKYSFFTDIVHRHVREFREALRSGRTYSDWNVNFAEKFRQVVEQYDQTLGTESCEADDRKYNIFVYGTLMKEKYNHDYYLRDEQFVGDGYISGYEMYDLGSFPGIVPGEGIVEGELYIIDDLQLDEIDRLEGEGFLYIKKKVEVILENGKKTEAFVYVYNHSVEGCCQLKRWR